MHAQQVRLKPGLFQRFKPGSGRSREPCVGIVILERAERQAGPVLGRNTILPPV